MDTETLAKTRYGRVFIRLLAAGMESKFRYRFFPPTNIIRGANIDPGQTVLEIGCGTGFFTIPAAQLVGEQGHLVAMDVVQESVDLVSQKVQTARLMNVRVIKGNALQTRFDVGSFDAVLLFGVIPAPMVPLNQLLREIHRILKLEGNLAVWPHIPGWLPRAIVDSGMFVFTSKQNGVINFGRCR